MSRLLSTILAVYELQAQQGQDRHLAFDGEMMMIAFIITLGEIM